MKHLLRVAACLLFGICALPAQSLSVASYNLRFSHLREHPQNTWEMRKDRVRALLEYYEFDIVGTQEPLPSQVAYLTEALPKYASIMKSLGKGEKYAQTCAILYNAERLEVLEEGHFWLSSEPHGPAKGGRVVSWGKFKDKKSGLDFYLFNTHLSSGDKAQIRLDSVKILIAQIQKTVGESGARVFVTGDFNATEGEETIKAMLSLPWLADSRALCQTPPYGPLKTHSGFDISMGAPDAETDRGEYIASRRPIDYIFVSKNISVLKHAAITDSYYGRFPSDHFPIAIRALLK